MFRITAHYDDPWHPLNGDVVTVASISELLCVALAKFEEDDPGVFMGLMPGERVEAYGYGVTYTVERI